MREIKFRVWDSDRKTMVFDFNAIGFPEYQLLQTEEQRLLCGVTIDHGDWVEYELMQYTGLKDKNGKEIYENDIVSFLDGHISSTENGMDVDEFIGLGRIIWCDDRKGWDITNRQSVDLEDCLDNNLEIVGNIYQNPELLK